MRCFLQIGDCWSLMLRYYHLPTIILNWLHWSCLNAKIKRTHLWQAVLKSLQNVLGLACHWGQNLSLGLEYKSLDLGRGFERKNPGQGVKVLNLLFHFKTFNIWTDCCTSNICKMFCNRYTQFLKYFFICANTLRNVLLIYCLNFRIEILKIVAYWVVTTDNCNEPKSLGLDVRVFSLGLKYLSLFIVWSWLQDCW